MIRYRQLTKAERLKWSAKAKKAMKSAAARGLVPAPMIFVKIDEAHIRRLCRENLAEFVPSYEELGGHYKATEQLYIHPFVGEVVSYVVRSLRGQKWSVFSANALMLKFWDKLEQFLADPDSIEAIRGGMELELEDSSQLTLSSVKGSLHV